jgi:prepilin peptidase CpaA
MQWSGAFTLAIVATWLDLRTHRIPNWLTFSAAGLGLFVATTTFGVSGAFASVAGLFVALLLFFPVFVLRGLRAGEVKLMGALGAWLGLSMVLGVAFYTTLTGGVLGLLVIGRHRYGRQTLRNLERLLRHWRFGTLDTVTLEEASMRPRLPYAVLTVVGLALAFWLHAAGTIGPSIRHPAPPPVTRDQPYVSAVNRCTHARQTSRGTA